MLSRSVEDYLEAIYETRRDDGSSRTIDIAKRLDIRPPSVTEMLRKLDEKGYVRYKEYRGATLTKTGEQIARVISHRHEMLTELLEKLGVPEDIAEKDACVMEHHLDPKTVEKLKGFLSFLKKNPNIL